MKRGRRAGKMKEREAKRQNIEFQETNRAIGSRFVPVCLRIFSRAENMRNDRREA
jgi:hypothetical protein